MTRCVRRTVLLAVFVVTASAAVGCGGNESGGGAVLRSFDSSWIQGQASLAAFPDFLTVISRADTLGDQALAQRKRELALLEAARIAAKKHAREAALRAYLEAKRRAEAAYRAALRRAAIERRKQMAKLRRLLRERAAALRRLNAKLRVPPGEECRDPLIRKHLRCRAGRLPVRTK